MRTRVAAVLAITSLALGKWAHADVLVVGPNPGEFEQVYYAALVAQDGDTILVRPGAPSGLGYWDFEIEGKGLSIIGLGAERPRIEHVAIRNLPPGSNVLLQNLQLWETTQSSVGDGTVFLEGNVGSVRIHDCEIRGLVDTEGGSSGWGIWAVDSADVAVADCNIVAGVPQNSAGAAGKHGLRIHDSNVAVFGCDILGGPAVAGPAAPKNPIGGNGALVLGGFLHAERTSFRGGDGAAADFFRDPGGDGGDGVRVERGAAALLDCTLVPGDPNLGPPSGQSGQPSSGNVEVLGGGTRVVSVAGTVASGQPYSIEVAGPSGEIATLFASGRSLFRTIDGVRGVQLVPRSVAGLDLSTAPMIATTTGVPAVFTATAPRLPLDKQAHVYVQGVHFDAVGEARFSNLEYLRIDGGIAPPR